MLDFWSVHLLEEPLKLLSINTYMVLYERSLQTKIDIVNLHLRRTSMEFGFFFGASMLFNNMFVGEYSQMDRP